MSGNVVRRRLRRLFGTEVVASDENSLERETKVDSPESVDGEHGRSCHHKAAGRKKASGCVPSSTGLKELEN